MIRSVGGWEKLFSTCTRHLLKSQNTHKLLELFATSCSLYACVREVSPGNPRVDNLVPCTAYHFIEEIEAFAIGRRRSGSRVQTSDAFCDYYSCSKRSTAMKLGSSIYMHHPSFELGNWRQADQPDPGGDSTSVITKTQPLARLLAYFQSPKSSAGGPISSYEWIQHTTGKWLLKLTFEEPSGK